MSSSTTPVTYPDVATNPQPTILPKPAGPVLAPSAASTSTTTTTAAAAEDDHADEATNGAENMETVAKEKDPKKSGT